MHSGPLSPRLPTPEPLGGTRRQWCRRDNPSPSLQASLTCKHWEMQTDNINKEIGHTSVISNFKNIEGSQQRSRGDDRKVYHTPLMNPFDPSTWSGFFSETTFYFMLLNGKKKPLILALNLCRQILETILLQKTPPKRKDVELVTQTLYVYPEPFWGLGGCQTPGNPCSVILTPAGIGAFLKTSSPGALILSEEAIFGMDPTCGGRR